MALSKETIEIIKSTAPVLEEHGVAITTVFYKNMFENHPELLNIFNHMNQKEGRQQTALANLVYEAAKNIDRLESLLPAVEQVGHKHRALGVKPEHYPIVGEHLIGGIKEVLGDGATDEIITAWTEAYGVIAQVFIDVENNMYKAAKEQAGGWKDFKEFEVVDKVKESEVITSFYLKAKDGDSIPSYEPGQYITVRVQTPGDKYTSIRHYSLSTAPGKDYFRISVKKEADVEPHGKVSSYLHDHVGVGDTVEVSAPAGDFVLNKEETAPVALISGGVGITPMITMLEELVNSKSDRDVTFIHAARNEAVHAFKEDVTKMVNELQNGSFYYGYNMPENKEGGHHFNGYLNEDFLANKVSKETVCYIVGPVPFMKSVAQILAKLGISEENIRYEFFGPAMNLEDVEVAI